MKATGGKANPKAVNEIVRMNEAPSLTKSTGRRTARRWRGASRG
jgi:hypothetical protein